MSNGSCDSYVLSESSLFVYSHKMILKTCGTTTLLMALEPLIAAARALGMSLEWLAYTRKDFTFPLVQKFPHRDPLEEVRGQLGAAGRASPARAVAEDCAARGRLDPPAPPTPPASRRRS